MKVWLLQANEPMPVTHPNQRLFRMGMIADELQKKNHEVTWFATTFDHFKKEQLYNSDKIIDVNNHYKLNLIWAPKYSKNISVRRIINHKYMAIKFRKKAKKLEKPDIIYVSFPTIEFAEEAVKYGVKNNIPVIVDIRDLWPDIFAQNLSKIKRIIALPYIKYMDYKTRKIMKFAYAINGISPKIVEWGVKKANRVIENKDRYFYMGYGKKQNLDKNVDININTDKFNICFFGTLNKQFQFDKVINLAKELEKDNVDILVCGLGEEYEKIEKANVSNIKLLGWLNKEQLQYVLQNSNIGLAPYKPTFDFQMSVSNKFAEYLSYGLPVVLTSGGFMGELIEKNKCGINNSNEKIIANEIRNIMVDDNLYKRMSQNSINLFNETFVASNIYKELVNYLENINNANCLKKEIDVK